MLSDFGDKFCIIIYQVIFSRYLDFILFEVFDAIDQKHFFKDH